LHSALLLKQASVAVTHAVQNHVVQKYAKKRNAVAIYAVMHVKNAANAKNHATVQKNAQKNVAQKHVVAAARKTK
jgi:hypothetical protein